MIGLLLLLFVLAVLLPRVFKAAVMTGLAVLIIFGLWLYGHPDCESVACEAAMRRYQENAR